MAERPKAPEMRGSAHRAWGEGVVARARFRKRLYIPTQTSKGWAAMFGGGGVHLYLSIGGGGFKQGTEDGTLRQRKKQENQPSC